MLSRPALSCVLPALFLLTSLAPVAAGADDSTTEPSWARLVVTVREGRPTTTRRFELPVRLDGSVASLHEGGQVPLPNATFNTAAAAAASGVVPVVSYTYQNVGFELSLRASSTEAGLVGLTGKVESSRVAPAAEEGGPPTILQTEQTFAVRLKRGASTRVVDQRGAQGRTQSGTQSGTQNGTQNGTQSGAFQVEIAVER